MGNPTGSFIWYELMTTDPEAAGRFYGEVVGWTFGNNEMPGGGIDYRMIHRKDGSNAGGVLTLNDEMIGNGAKPGWLGYIYVADVDAEVASITAEGGKIHMPPMTLEGIGRMAMVTDPQGAPFYLMTPTPPADKPDAASDVFSVDKPQTVRWNELVAPDDNAAVDFYTRHFGWTQEGAMPMGPMGDYRFFQQNGVGIGAVMKKGESMQGGWTFYFGVDDIDRAFTAIVSGGGKPRGEPMEIPGGEFAVQAQDPQGASFGLVGPRKA